VLTLKDDYLFLYIIMHGAVHGWTRLRWAYDIFLYLQSNRCDIKKVMHLAETIHAGHIVEQAFLLLEALFPSMIKTQNILLHKPQQRSIQLTALSFEFFENNYLVSDSFKKMPLYIKSLLYRSKLSNSKKPLTMLFASVIKIDRLFSCVNLPNKLSFLYYGLYPFWLIIFLIKSKILVSLGKSN
jgi:hypothetical protein